MTVCNEEITVIVKVFQSDSDNLKKGSKEISCRNVSFVKVFQKCQYKKREAK